MLICVLPVVETFLKKKKLNIYVLALAKGGKTRELKKHQIKAEMVSLTVHTITAL